MSEPQLTKKGTIRKRAPKKKIDYFTKDTENAILEYVKTEEPELRNIIYNKKIKYAFFKLTENIIHTYKFYHTDVDNIEDLQQEVIYFLLEKLHLFHHSKSINDRLQKIIVKEFKEKYIKNSFIDYTDNAKQVTQQQINEFIKTLTVSSECLEKISTLTPPKAYSYFGTIVKRYLINYGNTIYKKKINKIDITDISKNEEKTDNKFVYNIKDSYEKETRLDFFDLYTQYVSQNLQKLFPLTSKENKYAVKNFQIADIILDLFRKKDAVTIFNKKALYHNIKEMIFITTGNEVNTSQITVVSIKLHELYQELYIKYQNSEYPFDKVIFSVFI